ncbi:MAG: hypothetical protein ACREUA_02515 [Burkholderiales bacterium]
MDEAAHSAARSALNRAPCVFEKALLSRCMGCNLAARISLAEREIVACSITAARDDCASLLELLRERSTFALKLPRSGEPVRHAVTMKLQCGGLRGLQEALGAAESDAHQLVNAARQRWGSLLNLPWAEIVRAVVAWQGRRRHGLKEQP